jgi:hypothetical protein
MCKDAPDRHAVVVTILSVLATAAMPWPGSGEVKNFAGSDVLTTLLH